jgi:hypothetical protein
VLGRVPDGGVVAHRFFAAGEQVVEDEIVEQGAGLVNWNLRAMFFLACSHANSYSPFGHARTPRARPKDD